MFSVCDFKIWLLLLLTVLIYSIALKYKRKFPFACSPLQIITIFMIGLVLGLYTDFLAIALSETTKSQMIHFRNFEELLQLTAAGKCKLVTQPEFVNGFQDFVSIDQKSVTKESALR